MSESSETPSADPQPSLQYHIVILESDGDMSKASFASRDELVTKLKTLVNSDVSVVCFRGEFLPISRPPLRYLMLPDGNIPLWDEPENVEEDVGVHYMGADPILLEPPSEIKTTRTTQDDEFFSDAVADVGTIFDDPLPNPDD